MNLHSAAVVPVPGINATPIFQFLVVFAVLFEIDTFDVFDNDFYITVSSPIINQQFGMNAA